MNCHCGYLFLDRSGELLYGNRAFVESLRCSFDQLPRMIGMVIKKDNEMFTRVVRKVIYEHEEFIIPEYALTRSNADKQVFNITFRPLFIQQDGKNITLMIGMAVGHYGSKASI